LNHALGTAIAISLLLASCASEGLPTTITVKVAGAYSGGIYLKLCQEGGKEPAVIDAQGNGETSVCPNGRIAIVVLRQASRVYITPEQVKVDRTGDGIAVAVRANVP